MNAPTLRTLSTFPTELQSQVRAHRFDDIDELVQQVALALLEANSDDTMRAIFNRARSNARRFSQDVAHYGRALDAAADVAGGKQEPTPLNRRDIRRELSVRYNITTQRERAMVNGDLFAGDESGVPE